MIPGRSVFGPTLHSATTCRSVPMGAGMNSPSLCVSTTAADGESGRTVKAPAGSPPVQAWADETGGDGA